ESEVTRITDLRVFGAAAEIFLHDFLDRIIEYRHSSFHSGLRVYVCNSRHTAVLAGIVDVHLTNFLSGTFLYEVSINMQLPSISFKLLPIFHHVRFSLRFKIHNLYGISLTTN